MKELKQWLRLVFIVLICVVLGTAALASVYCIPTANINSNLIESTRLLEQEGLYPRPDSTVSSQLDNFTDALMLHTAGYQITESPLTEAILVHRLECVDNTSPLDSLIADVSGTDRQMEPTSYARYWHGYLVFLKPLLAFFTLGEIRQINTFVQFVLIALLFALLIKKKLYLYIFPTVFLLVSQKMSSTFISLQFSNVFYIYIVGLILLLLFYEKWKGTTKLLVYFTLLGVATAFFDLLTYPLVTFGVPVTLLLVLEKKRSLSEHLKTTVSSGAAWLLGFAGMWGGKGVIGTIITQRNIIGDIFSSAKKRSVGFAEGISLSSTIELNITTFLQSTFVLMIVAFCVLFFILIALRTYKAKSFAHILNNLIFVLLCFAPICWYIVLKQHSYIHYWFTYRECLITLFAGTVMLIKMYQDGRTVTQTPS